VRVFYRITTCLCKSAAAGARPAGGGREVSPGLENPQVSG